ncbi:hypothetical protein R3P38DRAFT_2773887 [Favolaschia claudopus]|uniref:J domain-containing protein n=1 Tax=Favolaschia claudopus TaxID=2862362 RepID=A0AAW0BWP0_9AGAR
MSEGSPLPRSSPIPTSPATSCPSPPPATQPRHEAPTTPPVWTPWKVPNNPASRPVPDKKALTFDISSTTVVSGVPSKHKAHVLVQYYRRYMAGGHPDSPVLSGDEEKKARVIASYEIACQYFRNKYQEAEEAAEHANSDDGHHTDSSDEEEEFEHPPPIFWFGGHPYQPGQDELSYADGASGIVNEIDRMLGDDQEKGRDRATKAWASAGLPHVFSFASAAGPVHGEPIERAWAESAPPVPSMPSPPSTSAPAPSVATPGPAGTSSASALTHPLRLVCIFGWRDVRCACKDGKHGDLKRNQTCAFNAHDGTMVVKSVSTEVVPLN